ncbi:MAG: hypothetical protein NZ480_00890, partial [Bdellovibrionaceae bacterium]|nr:hypothetical protein [Pseudobdellovibrionaceae bacterium]
MTFYLRYLSGRSRLTSVSLFLLFLSLFFINFPAFAVNYQGRLYDRESKPLAADNLRIHVRIKEGNLVSNCVLYYERHDISTVRSRGFFSIQIGTGQDRSFVSGLSNLSELWSKTSVEECLNSDHPTVTNPRLVGARTIDISRRIQIGVSTYSPSESGGESQIDWFPDEPISALPQANLAIHAQRADTLNIQGTSADQVLKWDGTRWIPDVLSLSQISGSVGSSRLADNAVTQNKLADDSVSSTKIQNNAVTLVKIQNIPQNSILGRYGMGTGPVQTISVGAGLNLSSTGVLSVNIGAALIPDNSISTSKIEDNAVTSDKIADGAIKNEDISSTAAISDSKLAQITTAGKVSGSAITSGTIGGSTGIDTSGMIKTTGNIVGGTVSGGAAS